MGEHLCATTCRIPKRHLPDCTDEQCRGCLPALAADGLMLCRYHAERIGADALEAAALDPDLALALTGQGEPGVRGDHGGLSLNDQAAEARTMLRAILSGWCRLIAEERGITLPGAWRWMLQPLPDGVEGPLVTFRRFHVSESIEALARYVVHHGQWLAAHPAAADCSAELRDLLRQCRAAAYPSGTRIVPVGLCPVVDDDGMPCDGKLRAMIRPGESLLPSAVGCDVDEAHRWAASEWRALGRTMGQRVVAVGGVA